MPALSQNMQMAAAIALHNPSKLYKRNRGLLAMGRRSLREYATTKRNTLPITKSAVRSFKKRVKKEMMM